MAKAKSECKETRECLKLMGNPYASLSIDDPVDEKSPRNLSEEQAHEAFRESQNPYAQHYYLGDPEKAPIPPIGEPKRQSALFVTRSRGLSKQRFQSSCRRILRQYLPSEERRILRPHHRDFIERNESRSAEERFLIIKKLSRYDLSQGENYNARFNRERDVLTEKKLHEIEQIIDN